MTSRPTLLALMAAAALAGALAMSIAFSGSAGPPAPGTDAGDDGAGAPSVPPGDPKPAPGGFGLSDGPADAPGGAPPAMPSTGAPAPAAHGVPRPDQPAAPATAGAPRAQPVPGAAAPPGAPVFYTRAEVVEFILSGDASSPVAALAARYPVGGNIVNIVTGGAAEAEMLLPPEGPIPGAFVPDDGFPPDTAPPSEPFPPGADVVGVPAMDAEPPEPAPAAAAPSARESSAEAIVEESAPAASPDLERRRIAGAEGFAPADSAPVPPPSPDHSTTNIQVEGVDEPDFVKNDARYIYIFDGGRLTVVDALPADTVRVLSGDAAGEVRESYRPGDASIVFRGQVGTPGDYRYDTMFLDGDLLVVVYEARQWASVPLDAGDPTRTVAVPLPFTYVLWIDVANRSAPVPAGEYAVDGEYHAARMIDGTVYLVTTTDLQERGPPGLPGLWHSTLEDRAPGAPCRGPAPEAGCAPGPIVPPAYHVGPVEEDPYLATVSALPSGGADASALTYLLGGDSTAYVSRSAVYLAVPREAPGPAEVLDGLRYTGLLRAMVEPIGAQWRQDALSASTRAGMPAADRLEEILSAVQSGYDALAPEKRAAALRDLDDLAYSRHFGAVPADPRTAVHRIGIGGAPGGSAALSYAAAGEVPGEPLDQFSMDEHGGMFRIATAVRDWRDPPHTAVSVLDAATMGTLASLEGIAPGEDMQSARFAGDTLFLVTFLRIDPFFVIDMSGPVPVILGELKIPGFSSYLQPYGPDTVVGVGTYLSENLDDHRRDGAVKVSLYDVSDYRRPALADEVVIGGPGTWSPAQSGHRALLADESRGIVALPVVFDWGWPEHDASAAGGAGWTGFYAFRTDADAASLGEPHAIRHGAAGDGAPSEGRSLYIADWLYTIYDGMLVVSELGDPGSRVKTIDLGR